MLCSLKSDVTKKKQIFSHRENAYYLKLCRNIMMQSIYTLNCLVLAHDYKTLASLVKRLGKLNEKL